MNKDTPKSYDDYSYLLPASEPETVFSRVLKAVNQIESIQDQFPGLAVLLLQELNRALARISFETPGEQTQRDSPW